MAEVAMQESLNVLDGAISDEAAETLREMVEEIG